MASLIYNKFKTGAMQGSYNLGSFPVYCMLVTDVYTADADHAYRSEITNEVTGIGYTSPGVALSSPTVTQDDTDDEGVFDDTANVTWGDNTTITARAAVLYGSSGLGAASDPLIAYIDFGADQTSSNGGFDITWNAEGILNLN